MRYAILQPGWDWKTECEYGTSLHLPWPRVQTLAMICRSMTLIRREWQHVKLCSVEDIHRQRESYNSAARRIIGDLGSPAVRPYNRIHESKS